MDILLAPRDPIAPVDKIPFICGDLTYDYGVFLTYPDRTGRDGSLQQPSTTIGSMHSFVRPISRESSKTLEPHFQTWLFFGLLSEWVGGNTWVDTLTPGSEEQAVKSSMRTSAVHSLYTKLVYEVEGQKWVSTKDLMVIIDEGFNSLQTEKEDPEYHFRRIWNIGLCIQHTEFVIYNCPTDFDRGIRSSIGVLGETLSFLLNDIFNSRGLRCSISGGFSGSYFTPEIEARMIKNGGWCPSDITRICAIYKSLHTYNILAKMDRSAPGRDHSACTRMRCRSYQIDPQTYVVGHCDAKCECKLLSVDGTATFKALKNEDSFPLLRITGNDSNPNDLSVEIVEMADETPYIAISHVWADGLGNPHANSLHVCQLAELRQLVIELNLSVLPVTELKKSPRPETLLACRVAELEKTTIDSKKSFLPVTELDKSPDSVLLWLDTFCCPIEPPDAKQLALEKLQRVYEKATHTLVLDTVLRAVSTKGMSMYEILCRIFTSSWMRRLWTLQESALSKSLWFQFLDRAVSLEQSMEWVTGEYDDHLEYRRIAIDMIDEERNMSVFLKGSYLDKEGAGLNHLDHALRHRSVSVPHDEPTCIAILMGLDVSSIIRIPEPERMKQVWSLLSRKRNGLPARMIIIHGDCYTEPGWRWAPKTLLDNMGNSTAFATRGIYWNDPAKGFPSSYGFKVKFPGILLKMREYNDGIPQQPWKEGLGRLPEKAITITFRDQKGDWFRLADYHKLDPQRSNYWRYTEDEMKEWWSRGQYPLEDIICTGNAAVILIEQTNTESMMGVLVSVRDDVQELDTLSGLPVRNEALVIVSRADKYETILWDMIDRNSQIVRQSEATKNALAVENKSSNEYNKAMRAVMDEMKKIMKDAIDADESFAFALERSWGQGMKDVVWKYIREFFNYDIVSTKLPDKQLWYVD